MAIFSKSIFYILRISGLLPMLLSPNRQNAQYSRGWVLYSTALLIALSFISLSRTWYLFNNDLSNYKFWSGLTNYTAFAIGAFSVLSSFYCSVVCVAMAVITARSKIAILDRLLEVDFLLQQGSSRKITILSHLAMLHMCVLIVYACMYSFNLFSWDTAGQLCKLVSTCALVELMELILNIGERFHRVNKQVVKVVTQRRNANGPWVVTLPSVEAMTDHETMTIPDLSVIHWMLCSVVHDTCEVYGPHMVACMIFIIGHLLFNPYHFFMNFSRKNIESLVLSANWLVIYVIHLYILVWPCSSVINESKETLRTVSRLMGRRLNGELFQELERFAHQITQREVVFTACGLFTLDAPVIVSIGSVVTTYLAIIIQIHSYTAARPHNLEHQTTDNSSITWNNSTA